MSTKEYAMLNSTEQILKQFRTFYPDTGEVIDCWAESHSEVYASALLHCGRGIIKVMTPTGWWEVLGFEIPETKRRHK
jgi:hypothetical protein